MLQRRAPDMHLCGLLRSKGLTPTLCVVLARVTPIQCFKGPHTSPHRRAAAECWPGPLV